MEELIQQITSRTGISEDQARQAVEMVVSFVKTKLPEPIASQIDPFLNGDTSSANILGQLSNLGSLFGGQK